MQPSVPQPVFLNVEYLFFLLTRATGGFLTYLFSVKFLHYLAIFATVLIIALIAIVLYYLVCLWELGQEGKKKISASSSSSVTPSSTVPSPSTTGGDHTVSSTGIIPRNETWENIRAKFLSENQSDWRLAIIEADIYMDKLLDARGYHGDTVSDKLKQITPAQLGSIQIAWEAHKVRNRIAHDGAAFVLTQPEARRTFSYFEIVFRDLEVIE
ncbi:hypothetical protein IT401_00110 [Candidatus Nomurabacteria bacterium]|nr:hypothetical protein [Candidatus Nomurabacteria bacterium]